MREYLKKLRAENGMSQRYVSELLSITPQSYQQVETGVRQSNMKTSMLFELAKLFNVPIAEFCAMEAAYQESRNAVLAQQGLAGE